MFETSIYPRDTCSNGLYTAADGLQFTKFCAVNLPFGDLSQVTVDSFEDCMEECSSHAPLCYGISYNFDSSTCWLKNETLTDYIADDETYSAVANSTQLQVGSTTCPYSNLEWVSTTSGLSFQIYCNRELSGDDYTPVNWASGQHADSLLECMELCSEAHPLCAGVAWDPTMSQGYANCYPKTSGSTSNLNSSSKYVFHSATASLPTINTTCADSSIIQYWATEFRVSCEQNIANNTIQGSHAASVDACIDLCGQYSSSSSTAQCVAIAFDNTMANGYDNCYLKSSSGPATSDMGANYTIAIAHNASSSSATSRSRTSAGVIAGATVGGVAGAAAIIAAISYFCFRRRSNQRNSLPSVSQEMDVAPRYSDGAAYNAVAQHDTTHSEAYNAPLGGKTATQELSNTNALHEMQTDERVHEMDSGRGNGLHMWDENGQKIGVK